MAFYRKILQKSPTIDKLTEVRPIITGLIQKTFLMQNVCKSNRTKIFPLSRGLEKV